MSDPPRLSTTHVGGLTAAMLDSARDDDAPAAARQRALVAFGAGTGAMLTAGMAEGGASVVAGAAGTGAVAATTAKVATWMAVAKWAGGGALIAVCTTAAVGSLTSQPAARIEPPAVVAPVSAATPIPAETAARPSPAAAVALDPAIVAPGPEMVPPPASRVQPISPSRIAPARAEAPGVSADIAPDPAMRAPDEKLADEVGWLDRASASIRSGDVDRGLQTLDEYKGHFPGGVLTPESQVLRIEALVRKGDRANATRLGETFLSRTPQNALAARVRSLLVSMQKEPMP